jgi:regulator of protease activity HflC (stomatin/prohibitin superfamily)
MIMITTIIILVILFILIINIRIIGQNTVAVVEFLGKYNRTMVAGFNMKIPFLESIREHVSLRQQNFGLQGNYPSKDKVITTIGTNLIYSVDKAENINGVKKYVYELENRSKSIEASVENSLRTYVAKETHEGLLENKEELALHIKGDLEVQFRDWGMQIHSFQITNVTFPETITNAMSEVVASEQLKKAAENKGEATKIQAIKEAEAEKERKRLQGEGIALERRAIAEGLKQSIEVVADATKQSPSEIVAILTLTQYLDTMKSIGSSDNSKVVFMDSSVTKTHDILAQIVAGIEGGEKMKR